MAVTPPLRYIHIDDYSPASLKRICIAVLALAAWAVFAAPAAARKEVVLYSFCQSTGCPDGQYPYSPMVQDARGNLFGTTLEGGNANNAGTIYELEKVKSGWLFHSLYSFCSQSGCTDGNAPEGGLIVDTAGNLYGTTVLGGRKNNGVIFELKRNGRFKVLYRFCEHAKCADGAGPVAGLTYQGQQSGQLYDGISTLYGTTESGGPANWGLVYSIAPGEQESVLYAFGANNNANDGQGPLAPVIMDSEGNLYGTTDGGGHPNGGTIFSITPAGNESMSFAFCSQGQDCGCNPGTGALLMRADGTLVGTTPQCGYYNEGVAYSFDSGTYTALAPFCNASHPCKSGARPESALVQDTSGNLYGVAPLIGRSDSDKGTVFELTGSKLKVLYAFCTQTNCVDGASPYSKLIMDSRGELFGTTTQGGAFNGGTIFELP
jgi:uncharacterized repeat protein (TIGR03803 family)